MGVNSPILRPILEGPRGQNLYCWRTDLDDSGIWPSPARRGLPILPYLHARIPRIMAVEQLPQMMMMVMMMVKMMMMTVMVMVMMMMMMMMMMII